MGDLISRAAAIGAIRDMCEECDSSYCGECRVSFPGRKDCEKVLEGLPSAQPEQQHGRVFNGIVVEYPSYNTYPEYKGKPYFSIKYTENGQKFIGYGTYNPEVLSEYLKEYFMPTAQPKSEERTAESAQNVPKEDLISRKAAIDAAESAFVRGVFPTPYIRELPSAQPEIIACGDCKHWICHDRRCGYWNHGVKPLDWCCHAERRTDQ